MSITNLLCRPADTLYHLTQTHLNVPRNQPPKLIEFRKLLDKRENIPYVEYGDFTCSETDSSNMVNPGDTCYFPPGFHYSPKVSEASNDSESDSPWHDNFGKAGDKREKQSEDQRQNGQQSSRKQSKRGGRSKRKLFMDMQIEILKCIVPPVGILCEIEKQRRRK